MANKEKFSHGASFEVYIPKNSTGIKSGDMVVMPRKFDPKSRSRLGALGRISPLATKDSAPWVVGIADSDFSSDTVGSTLYAAPTSNQAIPVYRTGVFRLPIVSTSGNAGDFIAYSSGASGAQLFDITNRAGWAIGVLEKTFSGATANDPQLVRLIPKDLFGPDMAYYLENRILNDCTVKAMSVLTVQSTVMIGYTFTGNREGQVFLLGGKRFRNTRVTRLNIGALTGGAVSRVKAKMIVARSGGFGYRTCSGYKTLITFTKTGFSNAYFVPTTQTSGELAIGYVVFASAVTAATAGMCFPVVGPVMLPTGSCHWAL